MAEDFSSKIGMDTTDWKTGVSQLNRDVRTVESGFRSVAAGMDDWSKSADGLKMRNSALTDIMAKQKSKVEVLEAEHKRMREEAEKNGDTTDSTARAIQEFGIKVNKAKEELAKSGKELRQNNTALDLMSESEKEAGTEADALTKGVEAAEKGTSKLEGAANAAGKSLGSTLAAGAKAAAAGIAAVGAAAAAGTKEAFDFAVGAGAMADNLLTMSAQTGVSAEDLQKWQYASNFVDVSVETMTGGMAKLTKQMGAAQGGSKTAKAAFKTLGVSVKDNNGNLRDSEDVFADCIDALGKIPNEAERDAKAMALFGKSAQELNPLILAGGDALKSLGDEAVAMGTVFSGDALNAMGSFDDSIQKMNATSEAAKTAIGTTVMPLFQPLVDLASSSMASVATAFQDGIQPGELETLVTELVTNITTGINSISTIITDALPLATTALTGLITALVAALPGLLETLLPAAMSLLQGVLDAITANVEPLTTLAVNLLTSIAGFLIENIPTLAATATTLVLGLVDGIIAALPDLIPAAVEMMVKLAVALVEAIPSLVEKLPEICTAIWEGLKNVDWLTLGTELLNGLVSGLQSAVTGVVDLVKGVFGTILQAIKDLFGIASPSKETAGIGGFLLDGLIGGISDAIGAAVDMVTKLFGKIWDAIKAIFGFGSESEESKDAKEAGKEITKGVAEGVTAVNGDAETAVNNTAQLILDKYKTALGVTDGHSTLTKPYGENVVHGIVDGMDAVNGVGSFESSANTTQSNVLSALNTAFGIGGGLFGDSSFASKFEPVGKAVAEGIAKGMRDAVDTIATAAKEAVEKALQAAKEAGEIKSPSRKAHDQIGLNLGFGVAGGILDSARTIEQAMSTVTNDLIMGSSRNAKGGTWGSAPAAGNTTITKSETLIINALEPPSPSETVRLWRNGQQRLEMGIAGGIA